MAPTPALLTPAVLATIQMLLHWGGGGGGGGVRELLPEPPPPLGPCPYLSSGLSLTSALFLPHSHSMH